MRYKLIKKSHFVYPLGKPMIPHLHCYQGLAVDDYDFVLDASNLGHPRLSLIEGHILVVERDRPCPGGDWRSFWI